MSESIIVRTPWQDLPRGAIIRDLSAVDIMIDVDDVICPTIDEIHALAYRRGLHDNSQPMRTWSGHEQYGCTPEVYWDVWSEFALSGGYLNTKPIPGAAEALRRLYWNGHRLHMVTARGWLAHAEDIRAWTPQWFENFGIPYHSLVFTRDKVKAQAELGIRYDYAIDDSPKNFQALIDDGVNAFLQHHTHNESFPERFAPLGRRLQHLEEFAEIILKDTE